MTLVDSFGQAYHWTADYTLNLTVPQILMINAGADVNKRRMDLRIAKQHRGTPKAQKEEPEPPAETWLGKPIDQLSTKEYMLYHASGMA
jgi:hypothetical protein